MQVSVQSVHCAGQPTVRPSQRSAAAIVILAQNSAHSTYGRDSRSTLERCLGLLYMNYAHAHEADVLVFHNGDFAPSDQAAGGSRHSLPFGA